jgi:ribA/ribD-fused uncharacterized protein
MIDSFRGEYRFLSNFYPANVVLDGLTYSSVEHAYQAAKTLDEHYRARIRHTATPGDAKRLGRRIFLRSDWKQAKVGVMFELLRQKFAEEPLRGRLLATGDEELVEGNEWGDTFWGVCGGRGENMLGMLLMRVRGELNAP